MPISEIQIRSIISQWLRDEKQKAEADMLMRTPPHTEDSLRHHMLCLEEVRDVADSAAQRCDYRPFASEAQSLLALHNLEREASEIDFRRLCNELAKASKSFCNYELDRIQGSNLRTANASPQFAQPENEVNERLLSSIACEYRDDKVASKEWTGRTIKNFAKIELFIDIIGDKNAKDIILEDVRRYKQCIIRLPSNRNKMPAYRGKSVEQILEMSIPDAEKLSHQSVQNHFICVKTFLSWAKTHKYIPSEDYTALLRIQTKKRAIEQRAPFNDEDLKRIFDPSIFFKEWTTPHRFWIPLLGLYTGCRLEELCQLHTCDVIIKNEMLCLSIRDGAEGQTVKNVHSVRVVPLHSVLVEGLGFARFVESQRAAGHERVFPELCKDEHSERYSHGVSKWFGRYKTKIGIGSNSAEGNKVFHSFRHSVSAKLNELQVREHVAAALLGHHHERLTYGVYGENVSSEMILKEAVSQLDFAIEVKELARLYAERFGPHLPL